MNEERDDRTIGEMPTRGWGGVPMPEPAPQAPAGDGEWRWDPSQTIGALPTVGAREAGLDLLANRYRVVRRIGDGGMGSVWLAEDTKLDNRRVAAKMLPAVLAGKKAACRQVKQEAIVAMKLSHPNIATVRGFEEEGGNPFLVMDYIEGTGLDDILGNKGKLTEAETLRLLAPVAAALDYAHSQGVVHRDVKPANVLVRKDGTPFVLDFGIAREIQETVTRVTGRFSSGTLLYMSPEQLHGRTPKAAQDVYSFAAMAYECLKGHPPFVHGRVEYQIDHDAPEPLEEGVASRELREGILAGLAKDPAARPATCEEVLGLGPAARRAQKAREAEEAKRLRMEEIRLVRERAIEEYKRQQKEARELEKARAMEARAVDWARVQKEKKDEAARKRGGRVRRLNRWWVWLSVASLAVLLLVPWWNLREATREKRYYALQEACELARDAKYSAALEKFAVREPSAWKRGVLLLPESKDEVQLREQWSVLKGLEPDLARAIEAAQSARKRLERLEREKKSEFAKNKSLAEEEWKAYEDARNAAENFRNALHRDEKGIPLGTEIDWVGLDTRYSTAAKQWGVAEKHFLAACQKIYLALNPTLEEQRTQLLAKHRGELDEARDGAEDERRLLVALEDRKNNQPVIAIGQDYAAQEWKTYQDCRRLAEDLMASIVYDGHGWPGRKTDAGEQPLPLDEKELTKLAEDYRSAAQAWKDAFTAYDQVCMRIEKAFNDDRRKLAEAIRQNEAAKRRLGELEQDVVRYEGAQKSRRAHNSWNQYDAFATQAEQLETGIRIKDGLPFPMPQKLQKDQLSNLCSRLDAARSNWTRAAQALSTAYKILDTEKEEEMDAAAEEAAKEAANAQPAPPDPPKPELVVTPTETPPPPDLTEAEDSPGVWRRTGRGVLEGLKVQGRALNPFYWGSEDSDSEPGPEVDRSAAGGDMPPMRPIDKKEAGR